MKKQEHLWKPYGISESFKGEEQRKKKKTKDGEGNQLGTKSLENWGQSLFSSFAFSRKLGILATVVGRPYLYKP